MELRKTAGRASFPRPALAGPEVLLESAIRHDRAIVIAGLTLVTAASWWWIPAMMLPSAAPMLMLYIAVIRRSGETAFARRAYALAGGYLSVWLIFSVVAAAGQRLLTTAD